VSQIGDFLVISGRYFVQFGYTFFWIKAASRDRNIPAACMQRENDAKPAYEVLLKRKHRFMHLFMHLQNFEMLLAFSKRNCQFLHQLATILGPDSK